MTDPVVTLEGRLSPRGGMASTACPIEQSLELIGNRSTFLLLREAFYGTTRFDDFVQRAGLSVSVAASRLKGLVAAGLLERRPYRPEGERTRHDYHLTSMGKDIFPVLVALAQWSDPGEDPTPVVFEHHGCGAPIRAELHCSEAHRVNMTDVALAPRD